MRVRTMNSRGGVYRSVGKETRGGSTGQSLGGFDIACESFSSGRKPGLVLGLVGLLG